MNVTDNLEDLIRELAKRGELVHISLTPSQDGKKFRTAYSMASAFGISFAEDEDPVKSVKLAVMTAKLKPMRKSIDLKAERVAEHVPEKVEDPHADLM